MSDMQLFSSLNFVFFIYKVHSLLHFLLSHMAVHHLHHLHYHHLHLLLLVQSFILNLRVGSSANHFFHRPFPFLPDWDGLLDHLMLLFCSTAGFVCMVFLTKPALSRFSNALKINELLFHHHSDDHWSSDWSVVIWADGMSYSQRWTFWTLT